MSKNKYSNLISNTFIFGISTFGSKLMVLLLTPLVTSYIQPELMATADLITSTSNLILPIMYLCIADSVIRFGMDSHYKKRDIFSVGMWTLLAGFLALLLLRKPLNLIDGLGGYVWLVYLYCLSSALRTMITSFIRASGFVRLFAVDGIITTITTLFFSLFFFIKMEWGISGYVLGTVLADFLSAITLFFFLRLYRFLRIRGIDHHTIADMFRYSLPLIITAVSWWFTNLSDRYFVRYMVSPYAQGVYSQAYKIPNLITLVSAFFTRAWELSAFSEYESKESVRFFSNVFRSYYTVVFLMTSFLVLLVKPITTVLLNKSYFDAWRYSLFLLLAVALSCLVTFLGAVYNAVKKNLMLTVTTLIGAVLNIVLNALLIPPMGPEGAALATFISFLVVFLIRMIDSRRYIPIQSQPVILALNVILLAAQALIGMYEVHLWILWESLLLIALILVNSKQLLYLMRHGMSMLHSRTPAG